MADPGSDTRLIRRIISGRGSIQQLSALPMRRCLVVAAKDVMRDAGHLEKLLNTLRHAEVKVVEDKGREPFLDDAKELAEVMRGFGPDALVALGGGSTVDLAKLMQVYSEYPGITLAQLMKRFSLPPLRRKPLFVAVPATSGTGSEATPIAVAKIPEETNGKISHRKAGVGSHDFVADIAVLDPTIPATLPPAVTAATGFDAFSHALEAFTSSRPENPIIDHLALWVLKSVFSNLVRVVSDGSDIGAREAMHVGATVAGMCIANRGVGLAHSLGMQIGSLYGVPHGIAVSLFLCDVIAYNYSSNKPRYDQVAQALGLGAGSDNRMPSLLVEAVRDFRRRIGLPESITSLGVERGDYLANSEIIVRGALKDGATSTNPRQPSDDDMFSLVAAAV